MRRNQSMDDTVITQFPVNGIRNPYPQPPEPQLLEALPAIDYTPYLKLFIALSMFILAALVAISVIEFWSADQTAQMNQLQQCMMRINPDPNTNYQLETYKCMNGN
jgi:hypothetical protein